MWVGGWRTRIHAGVKTENKNTCGCEDGEQEYLQVGRGRTRIHAGGKMENKNTCG
jgi:hypothetical protein